MTASSWLRVASWLANQVAAPVIGAALGWMLCRCLGLHPIPLPADIAGALAATAVQAFRTRRKR